MTQTISVKTQNVPGMQKPQQNTCDCCKNTARKQKHKTGKKQK